MRYRAEVSTPRQLAQALAILEFERIYAPMEFHSDETRVIAVPPVFIGRREREIIECLHGFKAVLAHTLGHIELIKGANLPVQIHGGFRLNITNSRSLAQYKVLGLADGVFSPECSLKHIGEISRYMSMGIISYGFLPLMVLRRCPVHDSPLCELGGCHKLTDRLGNRLQTVCRYGEAEVLNPVPLVMPDKDTGADFAVMRFAPGETVTLYPEPVSRFTRGLYNKKVK